MEKESAWDFEIYGTVRSDQYDSFYSTRHECFYFINSVIKGKWRKNISKKLNLLNVKLDLGKRPVMNNKEEFILFLKLQRARLLSLVPAKYRRKVKDFILRGKYNYRIKN